MNNTSLRYALAVVLAHAAVSLPHSAAHIAEDIWLPPAANAFVVLVILLAPFVALGLLHARRQRAGALLLVGSMVGALLFGIAYHFVLPSADNIVQVPPGAWRTPFVVTSVLLAVLEAAGAIVGAWMLNAQRRTIPRSAGG
jgi:amino acid permease